MSHHQKAGAIPLRHLQKSHDSFSLLDLEISRMEKPQNEESKSLNLQNCRHRNLPVIGSASIFSSSSFGSRLLDLK
ncbi:hypothetical protein RchiOBHm_Chr7g0243181 [Rosa chinensis]|uniref:Uncharacterized protein n=1 Tax=Rosa chinensis TaxID=74649 RepID=A0A2P6PIQ2_ROSCH|nr:hypothetical protein RchiOBHm_Chr7g0243181 [Rosa chinensis]